MTNTELTRSLMQATLKMQTSFRQAIQRKLKTNNVELTFEMLQIMVCLWRLEGVNQKVLADKTFKDKVSLTYLINNLEKKELVIRTEDETDRRNKLIHLTPQGIALRDRVMPLLNEIYAAAGQKMNTKRLEASLGHLQEIDDAFKEL